MDFDGAAAGRVCDVMLVYVKVEQRNPRLLNFFHSFFSKRARFAFLNKNRDLMIRGETDAQKGGCSNAELEHFFSGWLELPCKFELRGLAGGSVGERAYSG